MVLVTVLRTLFYQFFLIFVGLSLGFIFHSEWVGKKSIIVERSVKNIFYPIEYDERLERVIKEWGSYNVFMLKECPKEFEVLDENVYNEEWYWCRYKYRDHKGKIRFDEGTARIRWKTWEYYYEPDVLLDTPERIKVQIEEDKLDTQRRKAETERAKQREKEILENEYGPGRSN